MDQSPPIGPGWALTAIIILWGLAGALDQPIEEGPADMPETLADVEARIVNFPVQLLCFPDLEGRSTHLHRRGLVRTPKLIRHVVPTGDVAPSMGDGASPVLRCHVLN